MFEDCVSAIHEQRPRRPASRTVYCTVRKPTKREIVPLLLASHIPHLPRDSPCSEYLYPPRIGRHHMHEGITEDYTPQLLIARNLRLHILPPPTAVSAPAISLSKTSRPALDSVPGGTSQM